MLTVMLTGDLDVATARIRVRIRSRIRVRFKTRVRSPSVSATGRDRYRVRGSVRFRTRNLRGLRPRVRCGVTVRRSIKRLKLPCSRDQDSD